MPYAWPIPCKAILARPLEELSGKGGGWHAELLLLLRGPEEGPGADGDKFPPPPAWSCSRGWNHPLGLRGA